jgi:hypothetical protein
MPLPKRSLHPAGGNDRGPFLGTLELVAYAESQLAQIVWAGLGQRTACGPSPQVLYQNEIGRVRGQEGNLNVSAKAVQRLAHEPAAMRARANCASSNGAGRPRSRTARRALMPSSSSNRFQVYTVCRATPTATFEQSLPASSSRPARTCRFAASRNRFCTMPIVSSNTIPGERTHAAINSCHELGKDQ